MDSKIYGEPVTFENTDSKPRTIGKQIGEKGMFKIEKELSHIRKGLYLFIKETAPKAKKHGK